MAAGDYLRRLPPGSEAVAPEDYNMVINVLNGDAGAGAKVGAGFPGTNLAGSDLALRSLTILPNSPYGVLAAPGSIYDTSDTTQLAAYGINVKAPSVTIGGTTYVLGAKGDGVTNDKTAIQNMITAAAAVAGGRGKQMYHPPGTYIINGHLSMVGTPNLTWMGAGKRSAIIKRANATNDQGLQAYNSDGITIRDLGFDCNGPNQTSNQEMLRPDTSNGTADNWLVENCAFINIWAWAYLTRAFSFPSQQQQNCRILFCDFNAVAGATNDHLSVTASTGEFMGNWLNGFGFALVNIYECNNVVAIYNTVNMNGSGTGAAIRFSSCVDCVGIANVVNAGANDIAYQILKETDNGSARSGSAVQLVSNIATGVASSIGMEIDGMAGSIFNTELRNNIIDGCGTFLKYGTNTINTVTVEGGGYYNGTTAFVFTITPANFIHRNIRGINPIGTINAASSGTSLTPAIATGSTQNLTGYDCDVFITTGATNNVPAVTLQGVVTGQVVPISTSGRYVGHVRAMGTIALPGATLTGTSWVWVGQ